MPRSRGADSAQGARRERPDRVPRAFRCGTHPTGHHPARDARPDWRPTYHSSGPALLSATLCADRVLTAARYRPGDNAMADKPTIVLVHGFWGGAAHWHNVIVELAKLGHDRIRAGELPLTSLSDDAERARKMVAQQQGP